MENDIERHCQELDRCNQRGGRMLTVFDLLEARSLDLELAAYLMACISRGASFMVGASPGGAGKTTVMCALLNFVPVDVHLVAATQEVVHRAAEESISQQNCYICHEIGSGHYFAYLWGSALQEYCGLTEQGHILATNLHADDLEGAREQVCGDNGVPLEDFNGFELLVFLRMTTQSFDCERWVEKVYSSNASSGHALVYNAKQGTRPDSEGFLTDPRYIAACRVFLEEALQSGVRTIEETRQRVVDFLQDNRSM